MRWILSLFILLGSFSASAEVLLGIGAYQRLEKATSGYTYFLRNRVEYSVGYAFEKHAGLIEYSQKTIESADGNLAIRDQNKEIMAWYRYQLDFHRDAFFYYVMAGLGVTWDDVTTHLGGLSANGSSDKSLMGGVGGAVFYQFNSYIALGIDVKILESKNNSSEPTVEFSMIKLLCSF